MKQFTDAAIKRLKMTGKRYHVTEGNGLYLIVNATGKKTWASYYRGPDKKRHWLSLGDFPLYSLAEARQKNKDLQERSKEGYDPVSMVEGLGFDPTLEEVYKLFIKKSVDRKGNPLKDKTILGYTQVFKADIIPHIGQRKVRELRKRDILIILDKVIERKAHNQANQVYRRLRRVLSFAAARDIIEVSPMASMEPVGHTAKRQRVLSNEEIKILLNWRSNSPEASRILQLILITGARPGEVAGMTKTEIVGDWWTIPAERVKTGIPHRVYLTDLAKPLLPDNHFNLNPGAVAKQLRRDRTGKELSKDSKPTLLVKEAFVPHDLRRTMATGLASLSFSDEVINAVQGRAKLGIIGTYNLHTYDKERQKAAEAWARRLNAILTSKDIDNIVPIRKKQRK